MSEYKRWYENNEIVAKCIYKLENLPENKKHRIATYLAEEIIQKPPFIDMISNEVYNLATSESQRRRWYDFDEVVRIFIELLRHSPEEIKKEISIKALEFIFDLEENPKSIAIEPDENDGYLD